MMTDECGTAGETTKVSRNSACGKAYSKFNRNRKNPSPNHVRLADDAKEGEENY